MFKSLMVLTFAILFTTKVKSQDHGGVQQYYYSGNGESSIVPKIYYGNKNNWYGAVRYNYEESKTISLNVGKMFSHENLVSYSITPVAGIVMGKLNGITIGSNAEAAYKKLFFSSEFEYDFSIEKKYDDLFFNWSECGYQITNLVYGGIALQVTHHYAVKNRWEPGIMVGMIYKNWTFPVYLFNPGYSNMNFVIGMNWDWTRAK